MSVTSAFEKWAKGFSGCDGGNLKGDVWFCGIEWGLGKDHPIDEELKADRSKPPQEYRSPEEILKYPNVGIRLIKLITAMRGGSVQEYSRIAFETPFPFHKQSQYFKLNLFPVACKDTQAPWTEALKEATGFPTKAECLQWCRRNRFPEMRFWVEKGKPKLIVGFGARWEADFRKAFGFGASKGTTETVEGQKLIWMQNDDSILAIIPFLGWQGGLLNRDDSIQAFGKRLAQILIAKHFQRAVSQVYFPPNESLSHGSSYPTVSGSPLIVGFNPWALPTAIEFVHCVDVF